MGSLAPNAREETLLSECRGKDLRCTDFFQHVIHLKLGLDFSLHCDSLCNDAITTSDRTKETFALPLLMCRCIACSPLHLCLGSVSARFSFTNIINISCKSHLPVLETSQIWLSCMHIDWLPEPLHLTAMSSEGAPYSCKECLFPQGRIHATSALGLLIGSHPLLKAQAYWAW